MNTLPDAPYITEAERIGYPADDFMGSDDAYAAADRMINAEYHLGQAVSWLIKAADIADRHGRSEQIDEMIRRIEDMEYEVKKCRGSFDGRRK